MRNIVLALLLIPALAFAQSQNPRDVITQQVDRFVEDQREIYMERQKADAWADAFRPQPVIVAPQQDHSIPAGASDGAFNDSFPPGYVGSHHDAVLQGMINNP
jgi:hypothetical protein